MRVYRYTTPHGIAVTRTTSKVSYKKGLRHLLRGTRQPPRNLPFLRIRISGAVFAMGHRGGPPAARNRLVRPPGGVPAAEHAWRDAEPDPVAAAGGAPPLGGIRDAKRRAGGPPEAAAHTISRRGAQQAAFGVLRSAGADRGVPRRRKTPAWPWWAPSATICCSNSSRSRRSCRAAGIKTFTCSSATTSTSWTARRSRSSAVSTISSARVFPPWRSTAPAEQGSAPPATPRRADRLRPHAGRVHGQGGDRAARACGAATTTKWCCGRPSGTPFSGQPSELFERVQQASPSPYEFLLQFGDEQLVGASPEMFVRIEGQRVETCPSREPRGARGDPLRDADNIRELLEVHQRRVRADHVHGRGPQ